MFVTRNINNAKMTASVNRKQKTFEIKCMQGDRQLSHGLQKF